MRVTIKDIAAGAGVTPSVVSNVLTGRNSARCSPAKKQEIMELVRKMGYRPNKAAQGLVKKKSKQVGLLSYSPRDPAYAEIIAELHDQLSRRGYSIICGFWNSIDNVENAFESVLSYPLDGLVSLHDELYELIPEGLPVVFGGADFPGRNCVIQDKKKYFRDAADYLKKLGHTKIGYFASNDATLDALFLEVVQEYSFINRKEWNPKSTGFYEDALVAAKQLFKTADLPTALLCRNDYTALAAMKEAKKAGLKVPEDLTIIGADGLPAAFYSDPPLTTFRFPVEKFVEKLLEKLFTADSNKETVKIPLELQERGTSGKCRMEK
ncbi:MAG: LacI family DNA-binding transcriptional regulator [Lentisphaeria bacterium]|nr:LacI family DNA-binding transcriptional regulator [Lentisphaeria bacterium]